ncbi:kinetochore protein NDC80 homolog [Vigna unguiculata]|uniref:Kinetochore protein NDC80 n=1 Tax=Vigna unguiculata TaxID=3917 RepID=A0A4D6KJ31_VIGUN|nr:kinetochore protein NDC80 homolog [Vigna unguiculata]QCD76490.1 kinetochore protein NDC80 [Vigna unguiculata]
MRPTARRQPKDSFIPPPPTPVDFHHRQYPSRDSDVSSRPSSVGVGGRPTLDFYKERQFQQTVVSTINSFLSSHNFPITFKTTFPSAKDILETLKFLLSLLDFPSSKLEEDLPFLLKRLNYPFKINKSILRSPAAPHQWPSFLALIHWLVQIAKFHFHIASSPKQHNAINQYTVNSYMHYIRGDDDAVEEVDRSIQEKIQHQAAAAKERLDEARRSVAELNAELERLRTSPSPKEALEKEKAILENDVNKFHKMIDELSSRIEQAENVLAEKEKQLKAQEAEREKILEENEELKRRVETQTINPRDVERMKRELQTVERETAELEHARNAWEEKMWEIDTTISHKINDLEALALDCNQALRRLKIGNGIQYVLNGKGTTPAEIMGIDHKIMLKPALISFADEIKKVSMEKREECTSTRQKSDQNAARLEHKKNQLEAVQLRIDEMKAQLNKKKKETQEYTSACYAEANKMLEEVKLKDHEMDIMEKEAAEVLKTSQLKLQKAIKQSEEEIQVRAGELFKLVDSVSKFKEHVGSKISEMRRDLSETAAAVSIAVGGHLEKKMRLHQ